MKRILIVDPLSHMGHVHYNYGLISAASLKYKCHIVCDDFLKQNLINKGIPEECFIKSFPHKWNIVQLAKRHKKIIYHILFRFYSAIIILWCFINRKKFDHIIFTSTDIYTFFPLSYLFNNKCSVIDHGIGFISDFSYRTIWTLTNKKINLIVMEEWIKDYVEKELKSRNIFVVKHPLPHIDRSCIMPDNSCPSVFAPSNSNDESYLLSLTKMSSRTPLTIYAKSRKTEFLRDGICISCKYISNEVYRQYLTNAKYILLPYEDNYNYRISAVLFESIILNKHIILLNNNTLKNYIKIFPGHITLINREDNLYDIIDKISDNDIKMEADLSTYNSIGIADSLQTIIGKS